MKKLNIDEAIAHAKEAASKNRILSESDDLVRNSYGVGLKKMQCLLCAEKYEQLSEWLEELKHYKDLEEQGLLPKLPCRVGDTVYEVQKIRKRIQPYTVVSIHISNGGILFGWELKDGKGIYSKVNGFYDYDIGKTVFLTRDGAEDALKEMEK